MPEYSTLTDRYGRVHDYLRVSLTGRCNLNCGYCRPGGDTYCPGGGDGELSDSELLRLISLFVEMGVRKVRFTGGEPMLRDGIESLIAAVAGLQGVETVGLTTNGTLLAGRLPALSKAGLNSLNISLDSLDSENLRLITGVECFDRIWGAIEAALSERPVRLKLNTVVVRGVNDQELTGFVELTRENNICVRFIEYMPFGDNHWRPDKLVGWKEMLELINGKYPLVETGRDGVARCYRVGGFRGEIGFIAPLTGCFCGSCSRLRLTADGRLRLCLHDRGEAGLGAMLRAGADDGQLRDVIMNALATKVKEHGRTAGVNANGAAVACMSSIGG